MPGCSVLLHVLPLHHRWEEHQHRDRWFHRYCLVLMASYHSLSPPEHEGQLKSRKRSLHIDRNSTAFTVTCMGGLPDTCGLDVRATACLMGTKLHLPAAAVERVQQSPFTGEASCHCMIRRQLRILTVPCTVWLALPSMCSVAEGTTASCLFCLLQSLSAGSLGFLYTCGEFPPAVNVRPLSMPPD